MRTLLLALVLGLTVAAQQPPIDQPATPEPFVCDDCPNPQQPWMRGSVEIMCTAPEKAPEPSESGAKVVPCGKCQHRCDPFNEYSEQTDRRAWDPKCEARCSPKGCSCPHPCDT